jgi:hypothetical protein
LASTPPLVGHVIIKNVKYKDLDNIVSLIRHNSIIEVK